MPDSLNPSTYTRSRHVDFSTRTEGEDLIIEGYFVVFNQPYIVSPWEEEVVNAGAFEGCDMTDVRALVDHIPHLVLGRSIVKTLEFSIDEIGLFGTIRINAKDSDAVNLHSRVQRGDVDQASFGFDEKTVQYRDLPDGRVRREIMEIAKLWEISVCTFPAYEQTFVAARSRTQDAAQRAKVQIEKNKIRRRMKHA